MSKEKVPERETAPLDRTALSMVPPYFQNRTITRSKSERSVAVTVPDSVTRCPTENLLGTGSLNSTPRQSFLPNRGTVTSTLVGVAASEPFGASSVLKSTVFCVARSNETYPE